ncbi:MAG: acetolactate synthase small subunit [Pseudomonadota bacterium]
MQRIISLLLENEPGALSRVAGLFSARGYNIESLSVAPTEDPSVSRMTLVTGDDDDAIIEQITKQLNKLVDVIKLMDLTEGRFVEREMLLIKVRAASNNAKEDIHRLTDIFRGRILDVSNSTYIIELTGTREKLDAYVDALDHKNILEVVRSGAMGVGRGEKSLRI